MQKPLELVALTPPPTEQIRKRNASVAPQGQRRTRYSLPTGLESASPVGYRTRLSLSADEARQAAPILSLDRPKAFVPGPSPTEAELFEECALGILSSRQSTNFRGHKQVTLGPADSAEAARILQDIQHAKGPVLEHASHTHVVMSRPYRTPFTLLLTFVGHTPLLSLFSVPLRAWRKKTQHVDDIPTIGFLPYIHVGILADGMERAAVIASGGTRQANVLMAPFSSAARQKENQGPIKELEKLIGLTAADRRKGWRIRLVTQVGQTADPVPVPPPVLRKLGANLLAFRSERIQPGVNAEEKAPEQYQQRQDMRVPDELAFMAARGAFNAFAHWTGCDRDDAKSLLLLERVDVLTPGGKERLRSIRKDQNDITDKLVANLPLWADLPLMKMLSSNANRGRKAFALAGQRIYIGGLDRAEVEKVDLDWHHAIQAFGAASARSALVCELSGCIDLPAECDLLAGMCLMAGPVNQNDIGKQFYGYPDLLAGAFEERNPTSLLVWTLKAKTMTDPIGNEEQLLNTNQKGALVDLRCGPHEIIELKTTAGLQPMRQDGERVNAERAFADMDNFVVGTDGAPIPGNAGDPWHQTNETNPVWPD